jgi:membrane protein DedA with SNARE-associated domain
MDSLAPLLQQHGVALVFVFVLLEQGGLPIPAVPALLVAGALAGSGAFTTAEVLAAAVAASLIADLAWLYAGSRLGRRILGKICRISLEPDSCVRRTHEIYGRFGPRSLAFAKFIPGYSTLGPALAGIAARPCPCSSCGTGSARCCGPASRCSRACCSRLSWTT